MGIKLNKIESILMGDNFPLSIINLSKSGVCYLYIHDQNELVEKQKHHSFSSMSQEKVVSMQAEQ